MWYRQGTRRTGVPEKWAEMRRGTHEGTTLLSKRNETMLQTVQTHSSQFGFQTVKSARPFWSAAAARFFLFALGRTLGCPNTTALLGLGAALFLFKPTRGLFLDVPRRGGFLGA